VHSKRKVLYTNYRVEISRVGVTEVLRVLKLCLTLQDIVLIEITKCCWNTRCAPVHGSFATKML